jgi:hypothetical protein
MLPAVGGRQPCPVGGWRRRGHWHKHGILRRQDIRNVVADRRASPCAAGRNEATMSEYDHRDPAIVTDHPVG